jgi:hypothetical protein
MYDHTHRSDHDHDCDEGCRSGTRNRFFKDRLMTAADLGSEQRYGIQRRRLINRAVHGWGVVYGLALERPKRSDTDPPSRTLAVGPGMALDAYGREIVVVDEVELSPTNTFWRKPSNGCAPRSVEKLPAGRYVLAAHYAERLFGDAMPSDRCGCDEYEKKFTCETVVFSLMAIDTCPCGDPGCARDLGTLPSSADTDACGAESRGPHATLCRWVTRAKVAGDPKRLCKWQDQWMDPEVGVELGCIRVEARAGRCDPIIVSEIEDGCGPRRIVKNNDLLYDLIRGCDLTTIAGVSWSGWHRKLRDDDPVPWEEFATMFHDNADAQDPSATGTNFVVEFSQPVVIDSRSLDAVVMTVTPVDRDSQWLNVLRIPIAKIDTTPKLADADPPLPQGFTNRIRLYVSSFWIDDELRGGGTMLSETPFIVEIEIRGDLIVDRHGQAVDANARGVPQQPTPTGNGSPGGTFLSSFIVAPRPSRRQTGNARSRA